MNKKIVVHKYGGTSLKDPKLLYQCAQNIYQSYRQGHRPVVVVSAMGRKGDPYATDTFLGLAYAISDRPSLRELDLLMACGELISATLLAVQLQQLGCPAKALTGSQAGIITDGRFGTAEIITVETKRIRQLVDQDIVPVICGFQGVTEGGEITTLGRGGSDITAVAVAAALKLDEAVIYTDVPAVKTADPKLVKTAQPIFNLNYHEVLEMALEGARVIHPRAVERAMADDIKLVITSLADTKGPPTEIGPRSGLPRDSEVIRAITHLTGISQFLVTLKPVQLAEVLEEVADRAISLDLLSLSEYCHSFTVPQTRALEVEALLSSKDISCRRRDNCCKISLIGVGIRGMPGVMAKAFRPLLEREIPVFHTSESYTQIAVLVPEDKMEEALNCLHQVFFGEEG